MLSKEEYIIMQHYLEEGLSKTAIAQKLGVNRRTIHRYLKSGKSGPGYKPRPTKPSLLDPFKHYICSRLKDYPELSAQRLLTEVTERGYQGKYTILKDYIQTQRPVVPLPVEVRFEASPGEQAQADFAVFKTSFGTVYALLVVLSWSRYLWVRFFWHQDQLTLLTGLQRAMESFGGVPDTFLFDRMKAVVARTASDGRAIFTEELLRLAHHYGFQPKACQPYRAKTKGKVERSVSYLRQGFFYGRSFRDLEDLNQQVEVWLAQTANRRIHGTTHAVPAERLLQEVQHLKPLTGEPYLPVMSLVRKVSRDGYISYNSNEYSLPEGVLRGEVQVQVSPQHLHLYQQGKRLATHAIFSGRGERLLDPSHRHKIPPSFIPDLNQDYGSSDFVDVERRSLEIYEGVLQ